MRLSSELGSSHANSGRSTDGLFGFMCSDERTDGDRNATRLRMHDSITYTVRVPIQREDVCEVRCMQSPRASIAI